MKKYNLLFEAVKDSVNKIDPINLISGGAPEDEYQNEVLEIVKLLPEKSEKLSDKIYNIFLKAFSEEMINKETCNTLAQDINRRTEFYFKTNKS